MNSGSWFWPDVSDLEGATDATRLAMWCALVVGGATALFAVLSLFGLRVMGASLAALFDAALFAAIAYGLSKHSRFAATVGFLLYLIEKLYQLKTTGNFLGVGALSIVFLIGFLNGMRGAFAYHKLSAINAQNATAAPVPSDPSAPTAIG